jgi:hypothetical protein
MKGLREMGDELIKHDDLGVVAFSKRFEGLLKVSSQILKSQMLPEAYKTPEQVAMVILKGRELNLPEMATLQGMFPVGRNIGMSVQLMMTLIRRHQQFEAYDAKFEPDDISPVKCTVTMKRKNAGGIEVKSWTFSQADAQKAGLIKKDSNYEKWMKNMLLNRATANCARLLFPDALMGMYLSEELDSNLIEDAEIIETSYQKEPIQVYNQAKSALEKAIKTYKIEDLESWKELYADDMKSLEPRLSGVLTREYEAAYNKLKPKVINVDSNSKPAESSTEQTKTSSTGTQP